jgi:hypothetical protein
MRYAVVDNTTSLVVNVIMWDGTSEWSPPTGTAIYASDTADIGDRLQIDGQSYNFVPGP